MSILFKPAHPTRQSQGKQLKTSSLIHSLRGFPAFMRSTASLVLVTFTLMILQPTIAAAQAAKHAKPASPPHSSAETHLSRTLQRIEDKLARTEEKLQKRQDASAERHELKQLRQTLEQTDQTVRQDFNQVEQHIAQKGLASMILKRHQAMVAHYQEEYQALIEELNAIDKSSDDGQRRHHAKEAINRLRAQKNRRSHQPFEPKQLPNSILQPDPENKPKETEEAFVHAGLFNTPYPNLAVLGDFTFDKLAGASDPAYLAESDEIFLAQAIKDKAAELNYDPVKIYHWVRNHIEWQPTWGGIQNADLTLSTQRGNAMDIASLTIALLRASNIPARYVHGTIDVPAADFKNWAGGFTNITTAADFASTGGIPIATVVSGGQISKIRLEHVWVEAAIDYFPSRGAKNKDADSWIELDPSFKLYEYGQGLDITELLPFDAENLQEITFDSASSSGDNWIKNANLGALSSELEDYQDNVKDIMVKKGLNAKSVNDYLGAKKIISKEFSDLPSTLPNKKVVTGARYAELPDKLRNKITLKFYTNSTDRALDSPSINYSLNLSSLGEQRLGIRYLPASENDQQVITDLINNGGTSLPLYLLHVKPVIEIDGIEKMAGTEIQMGKEVYWDVAISGPVYRGAKSNTYRTVAGDSIVVGINASGVSEKRLQKRFESVDTTTAEENLNIVALQYWMMSDLADQVFAKQTQTHVQRMPSVGFFSSPIEVSYFFGIPRSGVYQARQMDIKGTIIAVAAENKESLIRLMKQSGMFGSYLESEVFNSVFSYGPGNSISAVQLLIDANYKGVSIHRITNDNYLSVVPTLQISDDVKQDIQSAVSHGFEVVVPQEEINRGSWSGAGYIILDPETGAGQYLIDGGLAGGRSDPCPTPSLIPVHDEITIVEAIVLAFVIVGLVVLALPEVATGITVLMELLLVAFGIGATPVMAATGPLPEETQAVWDRLFKPQWGEFPSSPPETISKTISPECSALSKKYNVTCRKPGTGYCDNESDPEKKAELIANSIECVNQRVEYMYTCAQGGDLDHWNEVRSRVQGIENCCPF